MWYQKAANVTFKNMPTNKKIRLGYFSADFCEHPSSWLTAYMFELHDKSKFELIGFSFGRDKKDEMYNKFHLHLTIL